MSASMERKSARQSRFRFPQIVPIEQPLLFVALAFVCGLAAGHRFKAIPFWLILEAVCWAVAAVCHLTRRGAIASILLLLGHFAAGAEFISIAATRADHSRVRRIATEAHDEPVRLLGVLASAPELAPDRIYLDLAVRQARTPESDEAVTGMVRLLIPFSDERTRREYDSLGLEIGCRVRAWARLKVRLGYRNPGAPDFDEQLELKGYDAVGTVKSPLLIERIDVGKPRPLLSWLFDFRARMMSVILRRLRQPAAGILAAGLFGNPHFLSREAGEAFRASGTYHLLVISGSHIALLGVLASLIVRRLVSNSVLQCVCVSILLWAYGLMVGAEPSVTRSVIMVTIALGALSIWRSSGGVNVLGASALGLLAWSPRDLFNPAFQLSFITVLAITAGAAPLHHRLKSIGEWRPRASTPYPPQARPIVRWCAEVLFWNEREFHAEMSRSSVRFRIEKADLAVRLGATRLGRLAQWFLRWSATAVVVTGCVQVCLLPFEVNYFHRVSIVAIAANLVVETLMTVLLLSGASFLLACQMTTRIASAAWIVDLMGRLILGATTMSVSWSGASIRVPDYGRWSPLICLLYFAPILVLIVILDRWNPLRQPIDRSRKARAIGVVTGLLAIVGVALVWHPVPHSFTPGRLGVTILDVGQGDAIAVDFPRGAMMLVDSGGRIAIGNQAHDGDFVEDRIGTGEAAVAPFLWFHGIKRIDVIAATHGHADHIEGFHEIIPAFRVGVAVTGVVPQSDAQFGFFEQAVKKKGIELRTLTRGDAFNLDGVRVDVLAPFAESRASAHSGNNESLVLRLSFGRRVILLTGDIERQIEERLVRSDVDLRADVLKVAHHGSRTSSTAAFLERVRPSYAVISVANPSPFGHPHAEVVQRFAAAGAHVLQTSQCGAITISTDGSDLRVETFVSCGN
jgi:competence protein ComEC